MIEKIRNSLTRSMLLSIAIRITIVVLAIAGLGYLHVVSVLESETLSKLDKYITERAQKESEIFILAEDNHITFKHSFLELWQQRQSADPSTRFNQLFEQVDDGTTRLVQEAFTGLDRGNNQTSGYLGQSRWISGFVGLNTPIDSAEFQNRLLLSYDLVDHFAEGWANRFANTYVSLPEGVNIVYWPELNWAQGASSDLDIPAEEWVYIANKQNNPQRESVWTGLYYDQTADEWMVSCETPVDDSDGRHLINVGHDILLNKLFERVFNDRLKGAYNYIIRDDGRVVAHPDFTSILNEKAGLVSVSDLAEFPIYEQYKAIMAQHEQTGKVEHIIDHSATDAFLAVGKIKGPDWIFVTVYPKSLLSTPASQAACFLLLIGFISLIVELIMLYLVLARKVLEPMKKFNEASKRITLGQYNLLPVLSDVAEKRTDEVGSLASTFIAMSNKIVAHNNELEHKIQQRTLELEQAKSEAEQLARTDVLTGLANRRSFFEVGNYAFDNARRNNTPLTILMLDLDRFKQINDTYGHDLGDVVLQKFSQCLLQLIRPSDFFARLGGEEFAILMNGTNNSGAVTLAEKVRLTVESLVIEADSIKLSITVSGGVAELDEPDTDINSVLKQADAALYQSKQSGRNRIMSANDIKSAW